MENSAPTKRSIMLSWQNVSNGKIYLLRNNYTFPFFNLCYLFVIWCCGEISINVPLYKKQSYRDVSNIKGRIHKLSIVRNLMNNMHRVAQQLGLCDMKKIQLKFKYCICIIRQIIWCNIKLKGNLGIKHWDGSHIINF